VQYTGTVRAVPGNRARNAARLRVYPQMLSPASDANIALVRRTYELWNCGGAEPLVEQIWPPDVVFYETPEMPDTGVYRGVEAVAGRMRDLVEAAGHFQITVCSLECCGDHVLAACVMSARGAISGLRLTRRIFHVMCCDGGRVREFRAHFDARQARREYDRLCGRLV
jgi:ketosteroid isomerase-like protein